MKAKKPAVVFDLDGTVCNTDHRQHFVSGDYGPKDFNKFYEKMEEDPPYEWCVELIHMYRERGHAIVFCSGRPSNYYDTTVRWIEKHCGISTDDYYILMRAEGDFRDDRIVKREIYVKHIEPFFNVRVVVDDRAKVVKMWREMGLVCLQCAPGEF